MRNLWWTPRAVTAHLTLALCEPGFVALTWWQLSRALGGNELSWMYVFEWPFFAGYAVYVWWRIVHDQAVGPLGRRQPVTSAAGAGAAGAAAGADAASTESTEQSPAAPEPATPSVDDARLAAYNRWLASLAEEDRRAAARRRAGAGGEQG